MLYGPAAGNTLWTGFGGPCETTNDGDVIAQYDKAANRWVMTQFSVAGGPPFYQCVAVSATSDATGTYNRYAFSYTDFNDYPKLGVWPDGYYVSYNMFHPLGKNFFFVGAKVCAFDRGAMLTAAAFNSAPAMADFCPPTSMGHKRLLAMKSTVGLDSSSARGLWIG